MIGIYNSDNSKYGNFELMLKAGLQSKIWTFSGLSVHGSACNIAWEEW